MPVNDPVSDMLARIRNATQIRQDSVLVPHSKLKLSIARILKDEGYIRDYDMPRGQAFPTLRLHLIYRPNRAAAIRGLKRISKPGLRVYAKSTGLPKVLGGLGIAIISTSQGLLTDRQAHRNRVGGEVVAYVW